MSMELPAALAPMEVFLGRRYSDGDEDALIRMGDEHEGHAAALLGLDGMGRGDIGRGGTGPGGTGPGGTGPGDMGPGDMGPAGTGAQVVGLGLKASAGIVLAHKGITLLQYALTAAALAETLATGGTLAPVVRQAGQRALDAVSTVTVNELPT
ncbi:hypothetical protein ACBJ59_32860 [Nonomuraea sp. MTCD27]|uniref:hypothetical protein n=1 Tax=Nonomuraea sp. MTCD27 TaxID=1676747 RepID=UPI0035C0C74A